MITLGRFLSLWGMLALAVAGAVSLYAGGRLVHDPVIFIALKWAVLSAALCLITAWLLALYHWAATTTLRPRTKRYWGLAIILGVFLGAAAYWWAGARRSPGSGSDGGSGRDPINTIVN